MYDVTDTGNFEHANILNLPKTLEEQATALGREARDLAEELTTSRAKLFAAREQRVHPGKDDKVIVAWNGLMIDAMARAGAVLGEQRYLDAGVAAADFLLTTLRRDDGRLLHTWRNGQAKLDAYLDDYANLANGLVSLYEATFDPRHLDAAMELMQTVLEHFADTENGGFFYTADDHEELIVRNKDFTDNAVPSGNAMAATVLVRLGKLTGKQAYLEAAEAAMVSNVSLIKRAPSATAQMLLAIDLYLGPTYEIILAGDPQGQPTQAILADLRRRFLPNKVLAFAAEGKQPSAALHDLLQGKTMLGGQPTLFVCEGFTCQAPAQGDVAISAALDKLMPKGLFE